MAVTRRSILLILLLTAPVAWGLLLLYARFVPPHTFLAFTCFFALLALALTSTLTPVAYALGSRLFPLHIYQATLRHAARQAILLTLIVLFNLILSALHSWNIYTSLAILAAVVVFEILALARK
ncbi:hypothetical protein KSD_31720 [Ktedonobacter sp. SOSP1-85]|uniref:hypothetical protein n=1 Tax=Ktedonobacter sp. SOSP1-85 TaxID=2778367 RepID=UPI0019164138|nr:hypothetical protein [Ktedonobacter sp. SOSP1-85]GHO75401.1 hypothetical protein KSD_31720 [Ktedonobacter sp. SOSP1-85]